MTKRRRTVFPRRGVTIRWLVRVLFAIGRRADRRDPCATSRRAPNSSPKISSQSCKRNPGIGLPSPSCTSTRTEPTTDEERFSSSSWPSTDERPGGKFTPLISRCYRDEAVGSQCRPPQPDRVGAIVFEVVNRQLCRRYLQNAARHHDRAVVPVERIEPRPHERLHEGAVEVPAIAARQQHGFG